MFVSSKMSTRSTEGTFFFTILSQRAYISCVDWILAGFLKRCEEAGEKLLKFSSPVIPVTFEVILLSDDLFFGVCLN